MRPGARNHPALTPRPAHSSLLPHAAPRAKAVAVRARYALRHPTNPLKSNLPRTRKSSVTRVDIQCAQIVFFFSIYLLGHPNPSFPLLTHSGRTAVVTRAAAKQLVFNKNDDAALKKMQAGVDKLASVVGVTLGPKGRNVRKPGFSFKV